jgi:hypothetical protein
MPDRDELVDHISLQSHIGQSNPRRLAGLPVGDARAQGVRQYLVGPSRADKVMVMGSDASDVAPELQIVHKP